MSKDILHQKPYNRKLRREIYSIKREVHKWLKDVKQVREDFKLRRTA